MSKINSKLINNGNYVNGPDNSTINAVALWNNETGTLLQNSNLFLDTDTGNLTVSGNIITSEFALPSNNFIFALQPNPSQTENIILTTPAVLGNQGDVLILGNNNVLEFSSISNNGNVSTTENTTLHAYYIPVWDIGVNKQLTTHGAVQITTTDLGGGNVSTNLHINSKGNAEANVYIGENSNTASLYVFGLASIDSDLICGGNISSTSIESSEGSIDILNTNSLSFKNNNQNTVLSLEINDTASSPVKWFLPLTMPTIGQTLKVINVFNNPNEIYLGWA